ncbi:Pentatricopeptide repeat-containing protein At4g02750 [Linum perenne]
MVAAYANAGRFTEARKVFHDCPIKSSITWSGLIAGYCRHATWTAMLTGYSRNGECFQAMEFFRLMRAEGVEINQFTFPSVLTACAAVLAGNFGVQVHGCIVKSGFGANIFVQSALVDMYAKCGAILDANRVFDAMQTRNVISWTALIVGYAQNGKGMNSLLLYEQMLSAGIDPDYITFIGLLFACSHTGNLEKGRSYFNSMDSVYGIKPGPEHYACMIDLFGRSGKLTEAKQILDQMTVQPDATVWKSLLATCRIHKELELGQRAANNLFELEPNNSMPYVMLSNMYASTGRWEDAAGIRKLMKSRGISKEPGSSWTHTNGKVHTFVSEDRSHPMMKEIYLKVDEVIAVIKEAGYVPDMDYALHDMEKEGKELGLAYHSEKLAVAFALLVMPIGAPIRIYKNLRVCGDCHAAFKYVSRLYGRCISLRDSNCFHHFVDGKCSCGDYW